MNTARHYWRGRLAYAVRQKHALSLLDGDIHAIGTRNMRHALS